MPKKRSPTGSDSTQAVVDRVADQLQRDIASGVLKPGERLIVAELAQQLTVSHNRIREVLRRLERLGLVTLRPNRGAVVSVLTAEDIVEVYILRTSLGAVAIGHLIGSGRVTPEVAAHLTVLEAAARRQETRSEQALTVAADLAFQSAIVEACGLPRIVRPFTHTTTEVQRFVTTSGIVYPSVQDIVDAHAALLGAIVGERAEDAVELWRTRMRIAVAEFLELVPNGSRLARERPWLWDLL